MRKLVLAAVVLLLGMPLNAQFGDASSPHVDVSAVSIPVSLVAQNQLIPQPTPSNLLKTNLVDIHWLPALRRLNIYEGRIVKAMTKDPMGAMQEVKRLFGEKSNVGEGKLDEATNSLSGNAAVEEAKSGNGDGGGSKGASDFNFPEPGAYLPEAQAATRHNDVYLVSATARFDTKSKSWSYKFFSTEGKEFIHVDAGAAGVLKVRREPASEDDAPFALADFAKLISLGTAVNTVRKRGFSAVRVQLAPSSQEQVVFDFALDGNGVLELDALSGAVISEPRQKTKNSR